MKAFLKNYRQSPRKVRLVADLLKGKRVADGFVELGALPKRASGPVGKLLASAVANAKQAGISTDNLYIQNITVNKGIVLKRSMPRARGSASRINKRTSHVMLTLIEKGGEKKVKATKTEKAAKKETKPAVKKVAKAKAPVTTKE
ncbi:MAG TPA: 50S ribosomal protein L22 [Cyclobacteriaceae bacterium]|jgi:large subunit ribosomal protein L22|nr:50S ribosomal protein L22 [Cyclobacteriaceae bacterium]